MAGKCLCLMSKMSEVKNVIGKHIHIFAHANFYVCIEIEKGLFLVLLDFL